MLIEFSVENFRSIRKRVTLSMIAANLHSRPEQLDEDNVIEVNGKISLLRSAVIYGANASGKSNLIKALAFMRHFVSDSAREGQAEDNIDVEPFQLNRTTARNPSAFEAVFLLEGIQYRYGFSASTDRVLAEWLYYVPTTREVELFTRDEEGIYVKSRFREGRGLEERTRDNALFLSVVAQFNGKTANSVRHWFVTTVRTLTAIDDMGYLPYTVKCIETGRYQVQFDELLRRLDLDIKGLSVVEQPLPDQLANLSELLAASQQPQAEDKQRRFTIPGVTSRRTLKELHTRHVIQDDEGRAVEEVEFSMSAMESEGTQKLIALMGPLFDVLTNGWVLFVDEIDARLHPLITVALLRLFNSLETNPKNAQLICATHDTNLLDAQALRRDQVYFVEKDLTASTRLYSLADFKLENAQGQLRTVRNDASLEKDYIQGRYGAIPYLGDLNRLFAEELQRDEETTGQKNVLHEVGR